MAETVTALDTAWHQIDGDVCASEYRATFAQLDTIGETVYGVNVLEVINMLDACGSDWNVAREHGAYVTESSYVDVQGIDWRTARQVMDCNGVRDVRHNGQDDATVVTPDSVLERLAFIDLRTSDLRKLAAWERRERSETEQTELLELSREADTLRDWYALPYVQRAIMCASYGGYTDGQSLTFSTLREAMEYHGIPSSALWNEQEYDAPAPTDD